MEGAEASTEQDFSYEVPNCISFADAAAKAMIHGSRECLAILLKHSWHSCLGIASRTRFDMLRRSAL